MKEGAIGRVVGVDISEPAIEDAKINAELNGFGSSDDTHSERTRFIAARAEKVLAKECKKESTSTNVVAVVDPARDGLHSEVLKTLRMTDKIQRIVYVSCNPTGSLVRDSGFLCAPPTKRYPGRPFYPSHAQPVDMFPSTPHCEMVMTFDRLPEQSQHNTKSPD
jgi:tRNA (uracil-5-)-methyltransferase